ncbi:sugar ABC transporter ATP-binding protein [Actinomyces culturomici]|uniref:sugar ABC transporter ATP-binding protein n=1 Tax=Actinomyces culturomici TaxID=1926276 RepID=UPI001C554427|nr:sugar ABC transporter ATP-binding protein [Actinomyces culturomici]
MAAAAPLIEIRGLVKQFGTTQALKGVDFTLMPHSIHALLGQNGAGKSTLIKVLSGLYPPTAGEITVMGKPLGTPEAAAAMAFIHQDLGLVEAMSVAENVALATSYPRRGGFIDWKSVNRKAEEALEIVQLDVDPDVLIADLTRAERSLVAIARALSTDAPIIVLDEPTASLPAADSARLFDVLRDLRDRDRGLIYVSHRLDEVFTISDQVTVFRDGRLVHAGPIEAKSPQDLVIDIVGSKPKSYTSRAGSGERPIVLSGERVLAGPAGPVTFDVKAGEVLGMVGLTGAGQVQVGRAIGGAFPMHGGSLVIDGVAYAPKSPAEAVDRGVGFVTSNRMEEGMAPTMSVQENFLANMRPRGKGLLAWLNARQQDALGDELVETYGVLPANADLPIATLSGGNQQKVMFGRWLSASRKVIVLEEPTAGVDVGAKADIYELMEDSLRDGLAVVLVSSDFEEVASVCHRALVFVQGRVTDELSGDSLTVSNLTAACSGANLVHSK